MLGGPHFRVNSPPVVLETIDEETIIVNLDTGSYYDLNHVGGQVLHTLNAGADLEAAIDSVTARYDVERELVADPVRALVEDLAQEGIIVPAAEPASNGAPPAAEAGPPTRRYEDPALAKFTDMQELLLLDPVHEVDEAGWPSKA